MFRGRRMPRADGPLGLCDPFIKVWLRDGSDTNKHEKPRTWAAKNQTLEPVWNSCRNFGAANSTDRVYIELWDRDDLTQDDFLGSASVSVAVLAEAQQNHARQNSSKGSMATTNDGLIVLKMRKQQSKYWVLRRRNKPCLEIGLVQQPSQFPVKKTLYIVRHGQSVWNKAQNDLNVVELMSHTDHPLNKHGIRQAQQLSDKIENTANHSASETEFVSAQLILASPLTRAVQTALVGLQSIIFDPSQHAPTLKLAANAREKRNTGGRDSSGQAVGAQVRTRVLETLKPNLSPEAWAKRDYNKVVFDTLEVDSKWWIDHKEAEEALHERMDELMWQLRYMRESRVVLVGHSHFFRAMMQQYLSPAFVQHDPALAAKLKEKVLVNCGVIKLDLDFSDADPSQALANLISGVEFLFGSSLKEKEPKKE